MDGRLNRPFFIGVCQEEKKMRRYRGLRFVFLSAFIALGGVASSLDKFDTTITMDIDASGDTWNYKNDVDANTGITIEGNGTVIFEKTFTIPTGGLPGDDRGLYIAGGTNTFRGKVISGYLTTGASNSTNVFEDEVELWDEDRDPGGQPLVGHSLGISAGVNEFRKNVKTGNKHAAFSSSTSTFKAHLDAGTGTVSIGYGGPAKSLEGEGANNPAKIILDGTTAAITAKYIDVYEKGVLQVDSDATITGDLKIHNNGTIANAANTTLAATKLSLYDAIGTFNGKLQGSGSVSVNGTSTAIFKDIVNITGYLEVMDGLARTEFRGAVTAGCLAIDTIKGAGSSVNIFKDIVTLTDYDNDIIGPKQYSLVLIDGSNTFEKTVATGNKNAAFAKSTSIFNGHLNAGTGDVEIGFSSMLSSQPDISREFYTSAPGTVILASKNGSAPSITAANVNVFSSGVLAVDGNASINGSVYFANGSTYTSAFGIGMDSHLAVTGQAVIEDGAKASFALSGLTPEQILGKTILSTTGGVTGIFSNALYRFNNTGSSIEVAGVRHTSEALADVIGQRAYSKNNIRVGALYDNIMNDATVSDSIRSGMLATLEQSIELAEANGASGNTAINQLFGLGAIHSTIATRTTGQKFFGEMSGRLFRLRDTNATAASNLRSDGAYANTDPEYGCYQDKSNRIWAGGFGAWTRQDDKGGDYGYKYNSGGFILGYDYRIGDITFGLSGAYSSGTFKNNDGAGKTDVDTMNFGLYGSYDPDSGFYADASIGYGHTWNKDKSSFSFGGGRVTTSGKFQNHSFQAGTHIGYAFKVPGEVRIVPTVGVEYMHIYQKAWNERASNPAFSHWYGSSNTNYVEIPVGVRIARTWKLGGGASITPEIRGAWIYEANNPDTELQMGFMGSSSSTTIYGVNSGRSRGMVGAGVKASFTSNIDGFIDYNFEFRSGYKNHNIMAGLGVSF